MGTRQVGISALRRDLHEALDLLGTPTPEDMASTARLTTLLYRRCFTQASGPPDPIGDELLKSLREVTAIDNVSVVDGWFVAVSRTRDGRPPTRPLARLYWHVGAGGVVSLLAAARDALEPLDVPFVIKLPIDRPSCERVDTVVLSVPRTAVRGAGRAIRAIHSRLGDHVRPTTPLFTKRLLPGLAAADDPGDGRSYGFQRCALVARALRRSIAYPTDDLAGAIEHQLVRRGIDPDRPHLNPGAPCDLDLDDATGSGRSAGVIHAGPAITTSVHLDRADEIARAMTDTAITHDGRCSWLEVDPSGEEWRVKIRSVGPDLAAGTAGIAVFLARAALLSDDGPAAIVAERAIAHALHTAGSLAPHGLHLGQAGIGLAAITVGADLGRRDLILSGENVLRRVAAAPVVGASLAVPDGIAGTVIALLAARCELSDELARAVQVASAPTVALAAGEVGASAGDDALQRLAATRLCEASESLAGPEVTAVASVLVRACEVLEDPRVTDLARHAVGWCAATAGVTAAGADDRDTGATLATAGSIVARAARIIGAIPWAAVATGLADEAWESWCEQVTDEGGFARPGMMTGAAGHGMLHLRLADPSLPWWTLPM